MESHFCRTDIAQPIAPLASFSLVTALSRLHYQRGEQRLMLAVLIDAISCIERYGAGRGGKNWGDGRAAARWIGDDSQQWPFSFANICSALGFNAVKLRATLCTEFPTLFFTRTHEGTFRPKVSANLRQAQE